MTLKETDCFQSLWSFCFFYVTRTKSFIWMSGMIYKLSLTFSLSFSPTHKNVLPLLTLSNKPTAIRILFLFTTDGRTQVVFFLLYVFFFVCDSHQIFDLTCLYERSLSFFFFKDWHCKRWPNRIQYVNVICRHNRPNAEKPRDSTLRALFSL